MSRVLLTGGCGFLGARFAAHARDAGHAVTTADVLPGADRLLDIGDPAAVDALVEATRPQAIVHLAAGLTDAGERDPAGTTRINALGTAAIFAAGERGGCERIVYASSISAVGTVAGAAGDDARLTPGNVYGATKAFCEHLARAMSVRPRAPCYLGLRFGYVYGPGRVRGWREVQALIERVADGERELTYPDYPEAMDWTWIEDAALVLVRTIERALPPCSVVNVMGDKRRVRDAIAHLQRRFPDLRATAQHARLPVAGWGLVNDRLEGLLGVVPMTTLEQGIDAMLAARTSPRITPAR